MEISQSYAEPVAARPLRALIEIFDRIPQSFISLCARVFTAAVFWCRVRRRSTAGI
jgi:hypothetical protein